MAGYDDGYWDLGTWDGEVATLRLIRQKMLEMAPQLGSLEAMASATTTTVVVTRLATGSLSAQRYRDVWMLRPDALTAADRVRICTNFASSTGTLTHAGANYADTTITGEDLELHRFDPQRLDRDIAYSVGSIRKLDTDYIPTTPNLHDYQLTAFPWIEEPDDIVGVGMRTSPVLNRDPGFEKWLSLVTPTLDHWALSGTNAQMSQNTTPKRGKYAVTVERAGTDAILEQRVGLHDETGVASDSLRGKVLTLVGVIRTDTASQARVAVTDGTQTVTSDYHSGGGAWEELTASITVDDDATVLNLQGQVNVDGDAEFDEIKLVEGTYNDHQRRDHDHVRLLNRDEWEIGPGLSLRLSSLGRHNQYVVYSARPVETFDPSRIAAGTADSDDVDLPIDTAAIASLARFYRGLSGNRNEDTARYQQLAGYWEEQRQKAQAKLLTLPGRPQRNFGLDFTPPLVGGATAGRR